MLRSYVKRVYIDVHVSKFTFYKTIDPALADHFYIDGLYGARIGRVSVGANRREEGTS